MVHNKAIIFKKVPKGTPVPGQDIVVETREFNLNEAPPSGGITVKNFYASFDPYQRSRMRDANVKSYRAPFTLGRPIENANIGKVLKSDNPNFNAGDLVVGMIPTEEYSAVPKEITETMIRKIDNQYNLDLKQFLGPLGMPGLTAYSSFHEIGKPVKGETIFISAASGAVGQIVGQLAKHQGLRVIGSVGSDEKLDFITKELDFDGGFNYKKEKPIDALRRLAPNGVDIYYESVGGEQLEAALEVMNDYGRIIGSGMISQYNKLDHERYGITNLFHIISKRLTFRGFVVSDKNMGPVYLEERNRNVAKWLHDGTLKAKFSVIDGIDNGPEGFVGMLEGKNFGKSILKIADVN